MFFSKLLDGALALHENTALDRYNSLNCAIVVLRGLLQVTLPTEKSFMNMEFSSKPDWYGVAESTGTSIMAVEYADGVVIGADSRTTTGAYVANRVTDKLTKVHERIYCCRSGSAADTQAVADIASYHLDFHSIDLGTAPQVKTAATLFKNLCFDYREQLLAGIIVAGWDEENGGQVYTIPLGGMMVRQPFSIGGSGSTYIYGHVDATYKENMTKEECITFVSNALALAMFRDGSSGGVVRLACISKDGVERRKIYGDKLPKFYEG